MTTDHTTNAATHQPALPTLELPEYHGRTPVGMKTALTGAGTRITRAHGIDDRVVLVVEAKVRKAGHESTDDGLVYVENLKVIDLHELDATQGSRLLSALRSTRSGGTDIPLPDMGEVGYTDASGVVLTPAEVAALRGDPIRVILSAELTPAVIVLDDGTRMIWPDEFDENEPRPYVDENIGTENDPLVVLEVLHTITGEPLGAPAPAPVDAGMTAELADDLEALAADLGIVLDPAELDQYDDPPPQSVGGRGLVLVRTGAGVRDHDHDHAAVRSADDWDRDTFDADTFDADTSAPWSTPDDAPAPTVDTFTVGPTSAEFRFVDRNVPEVLDALVAVSDSETLARLRAAEEAGRGRKLKPRAGVLTGIDNRLAALDSAAAATAVTVQDVTTW